MSERADQGPGPQGLGRPSLLVGAGHLGALWGLAFVAPLFELLGRNADFFVARGNDSTDIVVFALIFALLPPLVMLAVEALAQLLSRELRWAIHLGLVGLLIAAIALAVIDRIVGAPGGLLIGFALGLGVAGCVAYSRTRFLRSVADVLIPVPAVLLAFFLFFSDVSDLVFPDEEAKAASIEIPSRTPVVEVIFDELPLGTLIDKRRQVNARRFPAFAELARTSTWYRGANTVAAFTPRAVPAILTGSLPGPDELPTSSDQPRSVFTLLGGTYRMNVLENSTNVCPADICGGGESSGSGRGALFSDLRVVSGHLLFPDGLAGELPDVDQTFGDFAQQANDTPRLRNARDPDRVAIALGRRTGEESIRISEFAEELAGGATLNLIHVEKPHYPWTHFPDGRKYSNLSSEFSDLFADGTRWDGPRSLTDLALQRHMLESGYTDLLLGDVIGAMQRAGLWDRALVVVVSDHGNAVIPQVPRRNPTPTNLGQIAPVPLFIKAPGQQRGRILDRPTCTTDVLPLTARELGIDYPWPRRRCPSKTVTVANSPEGETTLPAPRVERLRSAYVARIDELFGANGGWDPVLRFTPNPELVGRPLDSVDVLPSTDLVSASLEEEERLADVDAGSEVLLASLLRGQIEGGAPGQALAASVNGRIAAVGTTYEAADEVRFSLLVPPVFLTDGENRVTIHRVLDYGITPKLLPLGP